MDPMLKKPNPANPQPIRDVAPTPPPAQSIPVTITDSSPKPAPTVETTPKPVLSENDHPLSDPEVQHIPEAAPIAKVEEAPVEQAPQDHQEKPLAKELKAAKKQNKAKQAPKRSNATALAITLAVTVAAALSGLTVFIYLKTNS